MIALPAGARMLLATQPVDFRKGAHGLAALAAEMLGQDPFSGVVLVFRSRRADRIKILVWDASGLVLVWKQLEGNVFRWPPIVDGVMQLTPVEFAALFDGFDWSRMQVPKRIPRPTAAAQTRRAMRAAEVETASLPDDPAALRTLLVAALSRCDALEGERDALAARNERLQHLLEKLRRMQFGKRSERLPQDQLLFAFEEVEATLAADAAAAGKGSPELRQKHARQRRAGRGRLPAHLPRVEVVLTPESSACPCCRGALVEIGADTSERLDVIPAQFRVLVTRRPKLACRACPGTILQAPAPPRLIVGGMPTEATVAHVLVLLYADHLPLYRQVQILARGGARDRARRARRLDRDGGP